MTSASNMVIRMDFTYCFLRAYPAPIQIRESFTKRSPFATASRTPEKSADPAEEPGDPALRFFHTFLLPKPGGNLPDPPPGSFNTSR